MSTYPIIGFEVGFYLRLAWEPGVAQDTHSYSRHLIALKTIFTGKLTFFWFNLESKSKLRIFQWFSRGPQSKFEANRSRGSWVLIGQTNKKTDKQIYIETLKEGPNKCWYKRSDNLPPIPNSYIFATFNIFLTNKYSQSNLAQTWGQIEKKDERIKDYILLPSNCLRSRSLLLFWAVTKNLVSFKNVFNSSPVRCSLQ